MHYFRIRLILALIFSVTLVSLASTYFEVLAHKHVLRQELERRTKWMGVSVRPDLEQALATNNLSNLDAVVNRSKAATGALAILLYDAQGTLVASVGPPDVLKTLPYSVVVNVLRRGSETRAFGHAGNWEWLEEALPLYTGNQMQAELRIEAVRAHGKGILEPVRDQ